MTAIIPSLNETIEQMKQEILEDIKAGRVPADCPSFSSLHDYVDANCYGGFCNDDEIQMLTDHFGGIDGYPAQSRCAGAGVRERRL